MRHGSVSDTQHPVSGIRMYKIQSVDILFICVTLAKYNSSLVCMLFINTYRHSFKGEATLNGAVTNMHTAAI